MRHFKGDLEGELDKPGITPIQGPGRLADQFFDAVLFDRVDILLLCSQERLGLGARRLWVAVENIGPNEFPAALLFVHLCGPVVHLENDACLVTEAGNSLTQSSSFMEALQ